MKPEDYKAGTTILFHNIKYTSRSRCSDLYSGKILTYSDTKKWVRIRLDNNQNAIWYSVEDVSVVDTVTKEKVAWNIEDLKKEYKKVAENIEPSSTWAKFDYYPKDHVVQNLNYYLEIIDGTNWKLYLRNRLSIPKFALGGELHPYVIGEGKIDRPEMISMYTLINLKRIVDGLNIISPATETVKFYPNMTTSDESWALKSQSGDLKTKI